MRHGDVPIALCDARVSMSRTFQAMSAAHLREPFPEWRARKRRLCSLRDVILENRMKIAEAISEDFGKRSKHETDFLEVFTTLEDIKHALRRGEQWMRRQARPVSLWFQPGRAEVLPQPLGVVGVIVPWNYPLYLACAPLTGALAAGNRVMVKMSEHTPAFGALFRSLMQQVFADDEVHVVAGDAEVAAAFALLPFNHLLFTGSTAVGKLVMRAASENLTPVTLELGGKSPTLLLPDLVRDTGRFHKAVERIIVGKCWNAGQTCIAPDYVLLPRGSEDAFIGIARQVTAKLYPDFARTRDYSSIINERHYARLMSCLDDARQRGGVISPLIDVAPDPLVRRLPPTVVSGVTDSMKVATEEIFGPILPLLPYDSLDDAIAYVNSNSRPLALYVFGDERSDVDQVIRRTVAGGVAVNEVLLQVVQNDLPFGGVGASGMGHYHGHEGFVTFSKMKPIFRQSKFNGMGMFKAPYGALFERLMALVLR